MSIPLFLLCGGPAIHDAGVPKPLMRIDDRCTLITYHLRYLFRTRPTRPSQITLLCDTGQEAALAAEVATQRYPVPVHVLACGPAATTLTKVEVALQTVPTGAGRIRVGYPDIFFLGDPIEPPDATPEDRAVVHISAVALTSRFPRLHVDIYTSEVRGISDYRSPVPANPLHVYGGDLWADADRLRALVARFRAETDLAAPSLEHDCFAWLINQQCMRSVLRHGEQLLVDSPRDIQRLRATLGPCA